MAIRPAALADANSIIAFVTEGAKAYPELRADHDKVRKLVTEAISSAAHFCWVSVRDGKVQGLLAGLTGENLWAQRRCCSVPIWISNVPGDGVALLREFRNWFKGRRGIKVAGFAPDIEVDARVWQLAERVGFKRHGGAFLLYN